jgi:hypothetical protein
MTLTGLAGNTGLPGRTVIYSRDGTFVKTGKISKDEWSLFYFLGLK